MKNKQILISIGIILVAFVGYKLISSSIQENKEKAVLQEKFRLDELAKEPLNQCIDGINSSAENEIDRMHSLMRSVRSPESQNECLNSKLERGRNLNNLIASGKMTLQEYCEAPSFQEEQAEEDKILAKAKIEIQECYKRHK